MIRGRNRWLLRLAILSVGGLMFYLWATQDRSQEITVDNRSGQSITFLKLKIAENTHKLQDIKPGTTASASFSFKSGDHFEVEGQLGDGTTIRSRGVIGENIRDYVRLILQPGGELQFRRGGKN